MDANCTATISKLNENLKKYKFLIIAEGLEPHINFVIQLLNDIINEQQLNICKNEDVLSFLLLLEHISKEENIFNAYINLCINYLKNGFLIQNLFNDTITNNNMDGNIDNSINNNIDNEKFYHQENKTLIINNAPKNSKHLIKEIPEIAIKGNYFKHRFMDNDEEKETTYYYEQDGSLTYIGERTVGSQKFSEIFTNLLGNEIIEENNL